MLLAREAAYEARSEKSTDLMSSWHSGGRNRRHLKSPSTDSSASRCQHLSYPTNRFPLLRQSFFHHAILRTPDSTIVGLQTKMIGGVHEQNPRWA